MANDVTVRVRIKQQLGSEIGDIKSVLMQTMGAAVVPLTGAVAALGVELVGAGAAAGVFGAAVMPQISSIKNVATEQDAYNKAVTDYGKGSSQALAAQKKLKGDMDALTPATRQTAVAFGDMKDKFGKWSDSLSGSTMPVFTHLIKGLTNVFPLLTPLVKSTSAEFLGLSKRFEAFSKTDRFKELVHEFSDFAAGALHNVVDFMEKAGKAAASFATSQGFKDFLANGKAQLPGLAKALQNLAEFIGKFVQAAGPLGGLQLKVFEILADTLNKIPTDVLQTLVPLLVGAAGAMKLMKIAMMGFEMIKGLVLGFRLLAGATLEVDAAMDANPIGAVVLALTALAFGLMYAYNHSKTFRLIVQDSFDGVKLAGAEMAHVLLIGFKGLVDAWLWTGQIILDGAAKAFGWIPGLGGKLKKADKAFGELRNGVDDKFNSMISKTKEWSKSADDSMKIRKLKADITDWQSKLNTAKKNLKSVPASKRSALLATIADLESKIRKAKGDISSVHGKTVTFTYRTVGYIPTAAQVNAMNHANRATGGPVGHAAEGGSRNGFTMVGEHGPELVRLPMGASVFTNSDTGRMLGGGGGGTLRLQLEWTGGHAGDEFLTWLRRNIRIKGGNVQSVLGAN